MKEGDEWKAAFITEHGLFEPLVMFFGLTNSPATFQNMMDDIFHVEISNGKIIIYLDDILIFSTTLDDHISTVSRVFDIALKHKLFFKVEKCEFHKERIEYLGHIIEGGQIMMDPVKLAGIRDWPTPKNKKEVQSFLGFANYYRRFINNFSKIAKPLTILTGKEEWTWDENQDRSLLELKNALISAPVLVLPNVTEPFRIEVDASDFALGAVLSQKQGDKWHPVAYISKSLNLAERNYQVYDKEMLGIMTALDEFRHYILGAEHTTEILTDHKNLSFFKQPQKLNRRQARWAVELQDYDIHIVHVPGKENGKADLLSRRADYPQGKDDNQLVQVINNELFEEITLSSEKHACFVVTKP